MGMSTFHLAFLLALASASSQAPAPSGTVLVDDPFAQLIGPGVLQRAADDEQKAKATEKLAVQHEREAEARQASAQRQVAASKEREQAAEASAAKAGAAEAKEAAALEHAQEQERVEAAGEAGAQKQARAARQAEAAEKQREQAAEAEVGRARAEEAKESSAKKHAQEKERAEAAGEAMAQKQARAARQAEAAEDQTVDTAVRAAESKAAQKVQQALRLQNQAEGRALRQSRAGQLASEQALGAEVCAACLAVALLALLMYGRHVKKAFSPLAKPLLDPEMATSGEQERIIEELHSKVKQLEREKSEAAQQFQSELSQFEQRKEDQIVELQAQLKGFHHRATQKSASGNEETEQLRLKVQCMEEALAAHAQSKELEAGKDATILELRAELQTAQEEAACRGTLSQELEQAREAERSATARLQEVQEELQKLKTTSLTQTQVVASSPTLAGRSVTAPTGSSVLRAATIRRDQVTVAPTPATATATATASATVPARPTRQGQYSLGRPVLQKVAQSMDSPSSRALGA